MMKWIGLSTSLIALSLAGCSLPDNDERMKKMGLPPAGFVGSVTEGQPLYTANCTRCHGPQAEGTLQGPPLLHKLYVPGHHADLAFYMGVKQGVKQHHWNFGDMPALPQVSPTDAGNIVSYLRSIQQQRGIR